MVEYSRRSGKIIDTNIFYIICSNVLGGCMGTTGPSSINPKTKKPYGLKFPVITIGDMVRVQNRLIEKLGIEKLFAVIGGSMGGMQALEWAAQFGNKINAVVPIAASYDTLRRTLLFTKLVDKPLWLIQTGKKVITMQENFFPKRALLLE